MTQPSFFAICQKLKVDPTLPDFQRAHDVRKCVACAVCGTLGIRGRDLVVILDHGPDRTKRPKDAPRFVSVHPACYIVTVNEDALLGLPHAELRNVRMSDVPAATFRKLVAILDVPVPRLPPLEARIMWHLAPSGPRILSYGGRAITQARGRLYDKGLIEITGSSGDTLTDAGRRWIRNQK